MSSLKLYRFPDSLPREQEITARIDGQAVDVFATDAEPFVSFGCDGPVRISVELRQEPESAVVSPLRHGLEVTLRGRTVEFTIPSPSSFALQIDGRVTLFIFANPLEVDLPINDDANLILVKEGEILDPGELWLESGQTLYVQGGGVLRGRIRARDSADIRIDGYGVLDGASELLGQHRTRQILFSDCSHVSIRNVTMVRPTLWMVVIDHCEDVVVEGVKQIGACGSSDGIDIVGSRRVRISNCLLRNGDDCVALKSLDVSETKTRSEFADVSDVTVEGCALLSYRGGSAMEIGYELRCKRVSGIRFQNCDVIGVHQFGSVFGIHNSDGATIEDVMWSDIRVEHHYDKLFDLRIVSSRWGMDPYRGQIRKIRFRDVKVQMNPYNDGYSCSIIGGYDEDHNVTDVTFENLRMDGRLITNADELSLFTRRASGISFES